MEKPKAAQSSLRVCVLLQNTIPCNKILLGGGITFNEERMATSSRKFLPQLKKLRELEKQAQQIRRDLKISKQGEVLYQAAQSNWSDNEIVVEADGFGGATL